MGGAAPISEKCQTTPAAYMDIDARRRSAELKGKEKAAITEDDGSAAARSTLLWVRRTVYVHPSPFRKDNVPGYLAIATQQGPLKPQTPILLAFLPESLLRETDDDAEGKFISVENRLANDLLDVGSGASSGTTLDDSRETLDGIELDDKGVHLLCLPCL